MKAELKSINSIDIIGPLENYTPDDPKNFSLNVRLMIGPKGENGEESFDTIVCTRKWIEVESQRNEAFNNKYHLIVSEYNYDELINSIRSTIDELEADDWEGLAIKLDKLGYWEFKDYQGN